MKIYYSFFCLLLFSCCEKIEPDLTITGSKIPGSESRIAWDYSSLQRLVPLAGHEIQYSSYPRVTELINGDFYCVYESDRNIYSVRSEDKGVSWGQRKLLVLDRGELMMAVPEVIQLKTGRIIVSYNPRPVGVEKPDKRYAIETIHSDDNGETWSDAQVLYQAGTENYTSCAEPFILELPNGELQLYFANEADYIESKEQNISMFRSFDNGNSWGEKEIVCFSPTSRDGMPVALYLEETQEIILAIEDNYKMNFKPAIIRTDNNWDNAPVGRDNDSRYYALSHHLGSFAYQGAPYIVKLPSGNIALSYQGTQGRGGNDINNCSMFVEVGDQAGYRFKYSTEPFAIPFGKFALWNSLAVMDNRVWALASTKAYSTNTQEIWIISGYEICDYRIPAGDITRVSDTPFFIGHTSNTNVGIKLAQDEARLKIKATVRDMSVYDKDGVSFYIDPKNIASQSPESSIFAFHITSNGSAAVQEGNNAVWEEIDFAISDLSSTENSVGYEIDLSIEWNSIGGKPDSDARIGFSAELHEYTGPEVFSYTENLSMCEPNRPDTWATVVL